METDTSATFWVILARENNAVNAMTQIAAKTRTRETRYLMTKERSTGAAWALDSTNSSFSSMLLTSDISDTTSVKGKTANKR